MVQEIIDHFIRNSGLTMIQGFWITAAIWIVTIIFFSWTFRNESRSAIRILLFTPASSFFLLTLILDPRFIFLPLFLVVWKNKGWLRLMAALLSTVVIVDGLLLVLYALYDEKNWRHLVVAGALVSFVLLGQILIYGSPLPHFFKGISHQLTVYVDLPPMTQIKFIDAMYALWWGKAGLALGMFSVASAAFMWLQRDPLCCVMTTGLIIMIILNITLLADLWRYFAPQLMIFFGSFSPYKVVQRG